MVHGTRTRRGSKAQDGSGAKGEHTQLSLFVAEAAPDAYAAQRAAAVVEAPGPAPPASESFAARRSLKAAGDKHLQDILWEESLFAVRMATSCADLGELRRRLVAELPQNSALTRQRNATVILSRFFPGPDFDTFPRQVAASADDDTVRAVLGPLLLMAEPVLGRLFAERLFPVPPGTELPSEFFTSFGREVAGEGARAVKVAKRCSRAAGALGWTTRSRGRTWRMKPFFHPRAPILVFHHVYAPAPGLVDVSRVLAEPVWKYLGFPDAEAVRAWLHALEACGAFARYASADRLEQVTTRFTLDELIRVGEPTRPARRRR